MNESNKCGFTVTMFIFLSFLTLRFTPDFEACPLSSDLASDISRGTKNREYVQIVSLFQIARAIGNSDDKVPGPKTAKIC